MLLNDLFFLIYKEVNTVETKKEFPQLVTERLILRELNLNDSKCIFKHFSDANVCKYLLDEEPLTKTEETEQIINWYTNPEGKDHNRWGIVRKKDNVLMVTCGFHFSDTFLKNKGELKNMKKTISEMGETKNLIIRNSIIEECDELQKISESWGDKKVVEGEEFATDYFYKCLTEGDLPPLPNANRDYYRLKSIYLKNSGTLIGFVDLYHGYPTEETVWISIFVLDNEYRKNGFGQEIIDFISSEARKAEYIKIGIGVYLKNWAALRFWTKSGFDKILGIYGDEVYSDTTFALIGLEKSLL